MSVSLFPLKECVSIFGGGTPSKKVPEYWNGNIPWASVKDLKSTTLNSTEDSITKLGLENSASKLVNAGTIIIATRMAVGKAVISEIDVAINQDLKAVVCNENIDLKYLYYFLNASENKFEELSSGATVKGIKLEHILDLKIPLPPLTEQKHIAAILGAADSLRQKDQQLVDHYTQLSQSLFLDMFGDLTVNTKNWSTNFFPEVFDTRTGNLDSNAASEDGKYPFFTCAKQPLRIDSYSYDEEVLLLAGNNAAGIFDVKYYKGKFDAYQRTYILTIKTKELRYDYMKVALEQKLKDLQRLSIGSSTQYLTMQILNRLIFLMPPKELQNQFAKRIEKIDQQKQQAQANLERSNNLFNSLLQKAFTGELTSRKAA